jgi:hypothetical protein
MQQIKITKNILYLAILTTVVVMTWVFTSVWYSFTQSTTPAETNKYAEPIQPQFDIETMDTLNQRLSVPVDLSEEGSYITDPREQLESTDSAEISNPQTPIDTVISPTSTPELDQTL